MKREFLIGNKLWIDANRLWVLAGRSDFQALQPLLVMVTFSEVDRFGWLATLILDWSRRERLHENSVYSLPWRTPLDPLAIEVLQGKGEVTSSNHRQTAARVCWFSLSLCLPYELNAVTVASSIKTARRALLTSDTRQKVALVRIRDTVFNENFSSPLAVLHGSQSFGYTNEAICGTEEPDGARQKSQRHGGMMPGQNSAKIFASCL